MEEADKAVYTEVKVEINIAEEPVPLYLTDLCTGVIKDVRADRAVPAWTQHTAEGDAVANGHSDIVVKTEAGEDQPGLLHDFSHETSWTGKCLPAPNSEGKEEWGTRKPGESEHNEYPSAPELSVEDLRTSDNNPGRPHACPLCPANYKRPFHLREHMSKHTGEKDYACEKCDKTFRLPQYLKQHMLTHSGQRPHACPLCPATYKTSGKLKEHMIKHTEEKDHACAKCEEKFSTLQHLKSHMQLHSGQRPYKCPHCDASFMQPRTLTLHLRKGHPKHKYSSASEWIVAVADSVRTIDRTLEKPYSRHLCTAVANDHSDIVMKTEAREDQPGLLHDFSHDTTWTGKCLPAPNSEGKEGWGTRKPEESEHCEYQKDYACEKCDKTFRLPQYLKQHMLTHSGQRPHACPLCPATYKHSVNLKDHMFKHTGKKDHACEKCDDKFSLLKNLRQHMRIHSGQRPHTCPHCDATFIQPSNLMRHKRKGHPTLYGYSSAAEWNVAVADSVRTLEKPYSCHLCPAAYKLSHQLKKHMFKHTGEKAHACAKCDDKFSTLQHLKSHMQIHSGQRPHTCPHCDATFIHPNNLRQHKRKGHPALYRYSSAAERIVAVANSVRTIDRTLDKPYTCHLCTAAYKKSHHLREHMFKHTGEKAHACAKCDEAFSLPQHLKQHLLSHTGQRPYKCQHCDASFLRSYFLTRHIQVGHPKLSDQPSATEVSVGVESSTSSSNSNLDSPATEVNTCQNEVSSTECNWAVVVKLEPDIDM